MTAYILTNADVRVMDEGGTRTTTLAWRDGVLIDPATALPDAVRIDAGGRVVLPGFIDPHHHAALVALYGGARPLVAPEVTDIASLQRAIAAEATRVPGNGWLVVTEWNEELLAEGRAPTRAELDDASPDRPLFAMHYSCHRAVVNSRALELAGIDRHTPDPAGGLIERGRDGLPTGLLIERGMSAVEGLARSSLVARDPDGFVERLGRHYRAIVATGITRVVDAMVPEDLAVLYEEADRRGLVLVPTTIMPAAVTGGYLEAPWSAVETAPTGAMRGQVKVGPLKLVFDGAPVCAMCLGWWQVAGTMVGTLAMAVRQGSLAAIRTSASAKPTLGRKVRSGILMYDPSSANDIIRAATERGFAVATHAIGNAAIDLALDAFTACGARLHEHGTARMEHASFVSRDHIARMADLGIAIVTQPHFVTIPMIAHAPPIPGISYQPMRSLLAAGVVVAGSSDHPVTSFDPLAGLRSAVRRRTIVGETNEPAECLDLEQALTLYTRNAAKAASCLAECGTLEHGKRADLVVLDGADLDAFRVRATIVGGKTMHGEI